MCERVRGERLGERAAEECAIKVARGLRGRDRLLALMDVGATVCTARNPHCDQCPLAPVCATRGALADETKHRQGRYQGSFRQRRGIVMARLRENATVATIELDGEALASLLDDGLAEVTRGARTFRVRREPRRSGARTVRRPRRGLAARRVSAESGNKEIPEELVARVGEDRLGVELHAFDRKLPVAQAHHQAVLRLGGDLEDIGH